MGNSDSPVSLPVGPLFAIALTRDGTALAGRLATAFPGTRALGPKRFAGEVPGVQGFDAPVREVIASCWAGAGGFLLVMAAGIAVRAVAPLLTDKTVDPAVVVLDPQARFAVPLLSGHLGGANELAREVGRRMGSVPVLTTATDAAGTPAIEVWARQQGMGWDEREGVVRVNAAWANGEPVALYVDPELACPDLGAELDGHLAWRSGATGDDQPPACILVAVSHRREFLPGAALHLRPRCLHLGAGCRRDADPAEVVSGVRAALAAADLAEGAVAGVVSVDAKRDEPALHSLADALGVPFTTHPAAELAEVPVPTPSERVAEAVGTASVSEAAALLASDGGRLVCEKRKGSAWTLAVAIGRPAKGCSSRITSHDSPGRGDRTVRQKRPKGEPHGWGE